MEIEHSAALNVRKTAAHLFVDLGVRCLTEYEPHRRTWAELSADGAAIVKRSSTLLRRLEGIPDPKRGNDLSAASDTLLEALREVEAEKDLRMAIGKKGPRPSADDPRRAARRPDASGESRGAEHGADDEVTMRSLVGGAIEARAMSRSSGSDGGFAVPEQIDSMILDQLADPPARRGRHRVDRRLQEADQPARCGSVLGE